MIEKQKKAQDEAFALHKARVQEEEAKKAEAAASMDNDESQRINFKDLGNEEIGDIDDIWKFMIDLSLCQTRYLILICFTLG